MTGGRKLIKADVNGKQKRGRWRGRRGIEVE